MRAFHCLFEKIIHRANDWRTAGQVSQAVDVIVGTEKRRFAARGLSAEPRPRRSFRSSAVAIIFKGCDLDHNRDRRARSQPREHKTCRLDPRWRAGSLPVRPDRGTHPSHAGSGAKNFAREPKLTAIAANAPETGDRNLQPRRQSRWPADQSVPTDASRLDHRALPQSPAVQLPWRDNVCRSNAARTQPRQWLANFPH